MLFNSFEFLVFLPIVFLLYWFVFNRSLKWQNAFVVVASYVFYGWWDWRFLLLIAFTSLCSWASGLLIEKYADVPKSRNIFRDSRFYLWANILLNLGILGFFKYFNFFVQSFVDAFAAFGITLQATTLHIILPVGISFYTFQALSYSIDVYRKQLTPTRDAVAFLAYVSFFPQLVAGPIERATNLLPQFQRPRTFDYAQAVDGCRQMLWGFFKKIVIADNCAVYVNQVFDTYQDQSGSTLLLAAIFFTFQIYGDFSGYSDIAIGCAKLFGIQLMRNFNVPYFSRDIAEFWRRWHISLTTWFRDYIYIPLGGSRTTKAKIIRNTFIIFLVSGLWHGANWTFVIWGAYHAVLFMPLILMGKNRRFTDTVAANRILPTWRESGQMLLTFVLVVIGWVIFRAESITQVWEYLGRMWQWGTLKASYRFFTQSDIYTTSWLIVLMLVVEWVQRNKKHGLEFVVSYSWVVRYVVYAIMFLLLILFYGQNETFIYFQF